MEQLKFNVYADRVLVLPEVTPDKTKSGIIIPQIAQEKPKRGKVIGKGRTCEWAEVGDTVLYSKYTGTEVEIDGIEYLIMREGDIFGSFEGETTKEKHTGGYEEEEQQAHGEVITKRRGKGK